MATNDDSSVPTDTEKASNTQGDRRASAQSNKKLKLVDLVFRFLAFAGTLSAFVVMITNHQYKEPFYPLSDVKIWAKYHYSDAFTWFVVANGVAFGYLFLTLLLNAFNLSSTLSRVLLLLDLLVAYMIISAASAATAIAYVGENGLKAAQWNPICGTFHRYCAHVLGALIASFHGWLYLTIVIIANLHRRF